jgi:hypothetical protein
VNFKFLSAASAIALGCLSTPALAQHQHMPGMEMPAPKKPAAKEPATKPAANKPAAKKPVATKPAPQKPQAEHQHQAPSTDILTEQTPRPVESVPMDHLEMGQVTPSPAPDATTQAPMDHSTMRHGMAAEGEHADHETMTGALGPYPMTRESSGTAWQPDMTEHMGWMGRSGDWTLMTHGVLNLVYDHQSGRRGDDKAFVSGMLMGMAQRPIGDGTLQLKAMVSPDPLMGRSGYPLLLASGETANGTDRLIDRQHPHDFFMELSASVSQSIGGKGSAFIYAGLPGEPAFGPPAFMHREAILDSPEAPISHHWLDSTHITFGVVTGGLVLDRVKLEVSRFNAREPDQHRWNIETGPLDSTSVRLSWNPARELSLQASWGHFEDPEQLEPGVDQKRWSASALYAREIVPGWKLSGTLAWGRKTIDHHGESLKDDAYVAEASVKHSNWTVFGRGEITENRELLDLEEHGAAYRVGKVSVGAVRDFRIAKHFTLGAGGLLAVNFVPDGLAPLYGGRNPIGAMGFLRLKLD